MMMGMAALQVLVVRFFFQGARKGEFNVEVVDGADDGRIRLNNRILPAERCRIVVEP